MDEPSFVRREPDDAETGIQPGAAPFVWPPAQGDQVAAPPAVKQGVRLPGRPGRAERLAGVLRDAEAWWLAPAAATIAQRIGERGWKPDAPGVYCERCGGSVGLHEADEYGCAACRDTPRMHWDRFVRLGAHEGLLREFVHEVKYTGWRRVGIGIGRRLGEAVRRAGFPRENACAVPVPMPAVRRVVRGIDHAAVIARGVARELELPVVRALGRKGNARQTGATVTQRRKNVVGSYVAAKTIAANVRAVLVVDDVATTGATMRAACREVRKHWRKSHPGIPVPAVWAAAVAVSPAKDRLPVAQQGDQQGAYGAGEAERAGKIHGASW